MAIDERLRIVGKTINILAPEKDALTIGDKLKNANEYQSEMNKNAKKVIELQNRLSEQNRQLGNLSDKLSVTQTTLGNIQGTLQDVDIENLPIELQGISAQLSTLQTTLGDIEQAIGDIPVYGPATSVSNGLLTSELYMKLQSIQLATELIDGLLTKEDKQKLNKITVNKSIDLDQFMADFLALKDQVENM
jgi:chromosome segregation ATPase